MSTGVRQSVVKRRSVCHKRVVFRQRTEREATAALVCGPRAKVLRVVETRKIAPARVMQVTILLCDAVIYDAPIERLRDMREKRCVYVITSSKSCGDDHKGKSN